MNGFIKKAIFNHDLNGFVDPREINGTTSTIRITCGIDSVVDLLADLQSEWDKCKVANLSVYDYVLKKDIVIENITSEQLMRVFNEDKFYARMQMARDYADFNYLNRYGSGLLVNNDGPPEDPVNPKLTRSVLDKKERLEDGEKISLVITVTGL